MKYINKGYIIFSVAVIVLSFVYSTNKFVMYWDGLDYNEEVIKESCNVTLNEYFVRYREDQDFCPEAIDSANMIGGREIMWDGVLVTIISIIIAFNLVYFVIYKKINRRKTNTTEK